jgi:hypothetical protein
MEPDGVAELRRETPRHLAAFHDVGNRLLGNIVREMSET